MGLALRSARLRLFVGYAEVDRSKVDAAAKETLSKAIKGQTWTTPAGVKHTPLLVDNQVVGQLWEDSDPKTLIMGSFWAGPWGVNVELVKDGKVVGMVWVKSVRRRLNSAYRRRPRRFTCAAYSLL